MALWLMHRSHAGARARRIHHQAEPDSGVVYILSISQRAIVCLHQPVHALTVHIHSIAGIDIRETSGLSGEIIIRALSAAGLVPALQRVIEALVSVEGRQDRKSTRLNS